VKENITFVVIFSAMMITILLLHGCTQLDKRAASGRTWEARLISAPDGTCEMRVDVYHDDELTDDSISLENPKGK